MNTVLIVASPDDVHARSVAGEIRDRGVDVAFLDTRRLGDGVGISIETGRHGYFDLGERQVSFAEIRVSGIGVTRRLSCH